MRTVTKIENKVWVLAALLLMIFIQVSALPSISDRQRVLQGELQTMRVELTALRLRIAQLEKEIRSLKEEIAPVTEEIARYNPTLDNPSEVAVQVLRLSRRYNVDRGLILALGAAESDWRLGARGRDGEYGPLQVLPETFHLMRAGNDPTDWRQSLEAGVKYLSLALRRSEGDARLAVAFYNSGINRKASVARRISARHVRRVWGFIG